jgi:hypothetical protein|tara:strand:- start:132 stop:317 length:186 start_codon:yes stop_codon:yes gene_type:complete
MNNILNRQLKLTKKETYTIDDLKDISKTNLGDYFVFKNKEIKFTLLLRKRILLEINSLTID